jgi:hypothetical protein
MRICVPDMSGTALQVPADLNSLDRLFWTILLQLWPPA